MKEQSINLVLSLARERRENKTSWCGGFSIDKSVIEFCQSKGMIKYREARKMISLQSQFRKLERNFISAIEKQLKVKKFYNWKLFYIKGDNFDSPAFFPESINEEGGVVSHEKDVEEILNRDEGLKQKNADIKNTLDEFSSTTEFVYDWIHQLFVSGTLENDVEKFLKEKEDKKTKTRINRSLVNNFIKPEITCSVEEKGEPPTLSPTERQTLQFLLWKVENMSEIEERLKNLLLDGKNENAKRNGICVCFEETEVISNSYGNTSPSGHHYNEIKEALKSLSEKQRKLILKSQSEEIKISVPFLRKVEIEHRFKSDPEFKKYIAVYIDSQVLDIGEQYTSFPKNHFALLRHTPPKTNLTELEIAFFDILLSEINFDSSKSKILRRDKQKFLRLLDRDGSARDNWNISRLAKKIEGSLKDKAINLGYIEKFCIETNDAGKEIYCFYLAAREKISHFTC